VRGTGQQGAVFASSQAGPGFAGAGLAELQISAGFRATDPDCAGFGDVLGCVLTLMWIEYT